MDASRKVKIEFKRDCTGIHDIIMHDDVKSRPIGFCARDWKGWSSKPIVESKLFDYRDLFLRDRTLNGLKRKVRAAIADSMKQKGN